MQVLAWVATACVAAAVRAQDGSFLLDTRGGVEVIQGLQPPQLLLHHHRALSTPSRHLSPYTAAWSQYNQPANYAWSYAVDAPSTGDMKFAREQREGDLVVGQYSLVDPDGFRRVVEYSVTPETGFQATVNKEQNVASPLDKIQYQEQQKMQFYQAQKFSQSQNFNNDQYQFSDQFQRQNQWQDNVQQFSMESQSNLVPSSGVVLKTNLGNDFTAQQQQFKPNFDRAQRTHNFFNRFSPKMLTQFESKNFLDKESLFNAGFFSQDQRRLRSGYSPISVVLAN